MACPFLFQGLEETERKVLIKYKVHVMSTVKMHSSHSILKTAY